MWDVAQEEGQPALMAWYLADDTSGHIAPDELQGVSEAIHDVDPAHITVQADGVGAPTSRYTEYVKSTDGFLPELYPIHSKTGNHVADVIHGKSVAVMMSSGTPKAAQISPITSSVTASSPLSSM